MAKNSVVLKTWYDSLRDGKILGLKCSRCGEVEFPPVPVCNHCSCTDLEWVEMRGEATANTLSIVPFGNRPFFDEPMICLFVTTDEGNQFASWLEDVPVTEAENLIEKLPFKVTMTIKEMAGGKLHYPAFRLKEEI